jgi:NADP-dependent 3-hydroxy acid dehydrogenase YdfG
VLKSIDAEELTVFITGATAGFGAAATRRFAKAGSRVIAAGRRLERLEALRDELGARVLPLGLDVRDRSAVTAAIAALPDSHATVEVLVNNAGLGLEAGPAQETDPDDWQVMVDTNINGLLHCTQALLPGLCARDRGHIINIGSIAGTYPYPGGTVYGASKAFVNHFSLNLRADLIGHNVRVTSIEPGLAETDFAQVRFKGDSERAAAFYAQGRPMTAEDIAEAIFWVATLPRHLNINKLEMMSVMQAFGKFAFHSE